jgi:putative aldouronate transport system permease protein
VRERLSLPRIALRGALLLLAGLMLYPFWYVLCMGLSTYEQTVNSTILLLPAGFTLKPISYVLGASDFLHIYGNTLFVVVVGTTLSLLITVMFAYPLARRILGTKVLQWVTFFTLIFNGGIIPTFMVVRMTGLYNSLWSLIIPGVMNPFNVFLMRNFFNTIPETLDEAAQIEGAGSMWILIRIMLPLSLAGIATLALFYGVGYWNAYFNALLYINKRENWTLQVLLREILVTVQPDLFGGGMAGSGDQSTAAQMSMPVKMATVLVSTLPIMMIYPFIQKYFVTGVMVGAVKG